MENNAWKIICVLIISLMLVYIFTNCKIKTVNTEASGIAVFQVQNITSQNQEQSDYNISFYGWYNDPANHYRINTKTTSIFFNRVNKCASGVTRFVFQKLQNTNKFRIFNDLGRQNHPMMNGTITSENIQDRIIHPLTPRFPSEKVLLVGHIHFINLSHRTDIKMPLYINLIRDPVSRLISYYNFIRFKNPLTKLTFEERYRSFDDCVRLNTPECSDIDYISMIVPYFCGQDDVCKQSGQESLQLAKHNVVRYYSVVGYMERLSDYFKALEYMIPSYFANVFQTYQRMSTSLYRTRSQHIVNYPTNETIEIMKSRIPLEYEFYYFIRERFDTLMAEINRLQKI